MGGWVSLAITTIMVLVAYLVLNRTIVARTSRQEALEEIRREVGAIITELNATSERNIELIEDRIRTLEKVIAQADRRVGALRRDLSSREVESDTYRRLAVSTGSGRPVEPTRAGQDCGAGPDSRTEASREPRTASTSSAAGSGGNEPRRPADAPAVHVRERVRGLYLQGVTLERIASIVGKTVGEVELIVALGEGVEREQ